MMLMISLPSTPLLQTDLDQLPTQHPSQRSSASLWGVTRVSRSSKWERRWIFHIFLFCLLQEWYVIRLLFCLQWKCWLLSTKIVWKTITSSHHLFYGDSELWWVFLYNRSSGTKTSEASCVRLTVHVSLWWVWELCSKVPHLILVTNSCIVCVFILIFSRQNVRRYLLVQLYRCWGLCSRMFMFRWDLLDRMLEFEEIHDCSLSECCALKKVAHITMDVCVPKLRS